MARFGALVYGIAGYAIFFVTFLYLIGFVGNLWVPKSIDSGTPGPIGQAFLIDTLLLALFGIQHSVMARPGFKAWWTRVVPAPIERSTYVLATVAVLIPLFVFWQPIPQAVWATDGALSVLLLAGFLTGVALVLFSTFLIDHFDLFGLRQVVLYFRGRPYAEKSFTTPLLYKHIRHPLYVGWFATFWITPSMSVGHLLLALVWTAYILVAIPLEERDLAALLGDRYRSWRSRTPMFVPRLAGRGAAAREPVRNAAEVR